jgi:HlyD family secretion protein
MFVGTRTNTKGVDEKQCSWGHEQIRKAWTKNNVRGDTNKYERRGQKNTKGVDEKQKEMSQEKDIFIEGDTIENLFSDDLSPFLKWGMTWLFVVGIALFSMTWFLRWPEVIKAPAVLTSSESPKPLVPKVQAKLSELYFANGDEVTKGAIVALLDNTAAINEVKELAVLLADIDSAYTESIEEVVGVTLDYFQLSSLGDMQASYEQFSRAYSELKFALSDIYLTNKLILLSARVKSLKKMNYNLRLQRNTIYQEYANSESTYNNEKGLYEKGSITKYELQDYESAMLNKRTSFQSIKNSIIQNEGQQQDILEQRIQLTYSIEGQKNNFVQAFKSLKSAYAQWQNMYQLTSPIDGIISLPLSSQVGALVSPQAPVSYVMPQGSLPIFQIKLPQQNFYQLDTTKSVRIKLSAYPFEDFGVLEGTLRSISAMPIEGQYAAVVSLPKGLYSSFDKELSFINGMEGEAEIVLNDERLLLRLFRKIVE